MLPVNRSAKLATVFIVVLAFSFSVSAQTNQAGGTVILGNESGEVTATGGTVIVSDPIQGNLTVFGGDLSVRDNVSGNVNAFAGNTRVESGIGGRLSAFSGNLYLERDARVGDGLDANAGNVFIDGDVSGNSQINAANIVIGPNGTIDGDLTYTAENFTNRGTVTGNITELQTDTDGRYEFGPFGINVWNILFSFLSRLVIGAFLLLVFPGFTRKVVENFRDRTGGSALTGIAVLIISPMVLFLIFITLIGIPLAIIGLLFFVIAVWISTIYGSYALGDAAFENKWVALILGLLFWELLGIIPFVGWLMQFFILLIGLGALFLPVWSRSKEEYRDRTS